MTPATDWNPWRQLWEAIGADSYDGAPDAGPQAVGEGKTEEEAIADLKEQIRALRED